jgi:hypothetical protein
MDHFEENQDYKSQKANQGQSPKESKKPSDQN